MQSSGSRWSPLATAARELPNWNCIPSAYMSSGVSVETGWWTIPYRVDSLLGSSETIIQSEVEEDKRTVRFLECVTSVEITEPYLVFYRFLKNTGSILRDGIQEFPTLIPWNDAHTKTQKFACLTNAIFSVIRHTIPNYHFVFMGLIAIFFEFCFVLKYPVKTILPTLHSVALKSRNLTLVNIVNDLISIISTQNDYGILNNPRIRTIYLWPYLDTFLLVIFSDTIRFGSIGYDLVFRAIS